MAGKTDEQAPPPSANVVRAVRLTIAGIALSVVETILTVADRDSLQRRILQDNPNSSDVDSLVDVAVASGVLAGIAAILLWIRLANIIRRGSNWPVAITRALVAAVVLLTVVALADLASTLDAMLSGVWGVLTIAVIVLLAIRLFARRA